MNRISKYIKNNKTLVISSTIILMIILVMIIVDFLRNSSNEEHSKETSDWNTTNNTIETETTSDDGNSDTTEESETKEEVTSDETTTEETTTQEETTEPVAPVEYPYIIKVNRAANCTTVYGKDANGNYTVPVKAITVSCGKIIEDTPLGEFNTIISYDWRLMFDGTYGHYAYRIVGSTLFHSVPYYTASNDDLEWMEYNKLGTPSSLGCVRMTVADAKWLVENCPVGTKVIIYDDVANPGPLGKPETIKIPESSPYRGWDPTDPDPNNPWKDFSATISAPTSKIVTVEQGSQNSVILSYFKAKDTCGNDISNKMILSGEFDLNVSGNYNNVKVSVTDAIGRSDEVIFTLVVKAKEVETTPVETTTAEPVTEETTTEQETTEQQTTEVASSDETNETEQNNEE